MDGQGQGQEQLGQLEVAEAADMPASEADLAAQIEAIEKGLEEHQTAGRGQGLIGETDYRNGVDTTQNLCFTGSHERRLPLTGILVASESNDPLSGNVF